MELNAAISLDSKIQYLALVMKYKILFIGAFKTNLEDGSTEGKVFA
jgi:hypothetical protein